ncbi:ABC transporter ATP-binding protein [Brasilonema sp. CT11]|jgi:putative ABC transport system ATP-binding protein|nr:ABC transporter ATP-binding protein [Brasilonema sp. CT11]
MTKEFEEMADYKKKFDKFAQSKYQMNFTTRGAIIAKNVGMVINSKQQRLQILKKVYWEIQKGDIEILMGPSGSGKTTLLSILAGLLTPTAGNVYLLGQEITRMSRTQLAKFRRQNIGFIFQDFNLFPALTAIENVEAALNVKGIRGRSARKEAQALLEQVGLADKAKLLPRDLSGGQKQRVAIARALTGSPQIIMADEPTAALDSHSGHLVMELLRGLAKEQGCTVLIVTHDPRILDLADRVAHMEDGVLK